MFKFKSKRHRIVRNREEQVREIPHHICELNATVCDIFQHIKNGIFVSERRKLCEFLTVSAKHPLTFPLLKSSFQLDSEVRRHINNHPHTIHPLSQGRLWWEIIMFFVYAILIILNPWKAVSLVESLNPLGLQIFKHILDIFCYVDIIINFFTGYCDHNRNKFVLGKKRIAIRYLRTYFVADLLSSLPYDDVLEYNTIYNWSNLRFFNFLKLVRSLSVKKYSGHFVKLHYVSHKTQVVFLYGYYILLFFLYSATVYLALTDEPIAIKIAESVQMRKILLSIVNISGLFLHVEPPFLETHSTVKLLIDILLIIIGTAFNIFVFAKLVDLYGRHLIKSRKKQNLRQEIEQYMKYKGLSPLLKEKMDRLLNFKFQNALMKEEAILKHLSGPLQQEILMHNCKSFIERVDFFRDFTTDIMISIAGALRLETFIANDIIFQAGVTGNTMYFIYSGKVAVFTEDFRELCHLEEGSHFGEIALLVNIPRTATVVAITECELYRLQRKDFLEAIAPYPHLKNRLREQAVKRLRETQAMTGDYSLTESVTALFDK